jgi:hypothetical protein
MVTSQRVWLVLLGTLSLTVLLRWVDADRRPTSASTSASTSTSTSTEQPPAPARERGQPLPTPRTLLRQETSAYQARLFADEDGLLLVEQAGFTFLRPGRAAEAHAIALGPVAVRQGGSIVFWRAGSLRQVSLSGHDERLVAPLTRAPRYLLASESRLAWIDLDPKARASLQTLSGSEVRVVSESADGVSGSVIRDTVVYWILQGRDGSWRIGSIGLDGQHQKLTGARRGRPPAMLALGPDGVYFYAGPESGVRRLSFELDREDAVSTHVICSPLVVSDRVICAQVGGLFDVPAQGATPRFLASEPEGPITALAASGDSLFWVAESGGDHLVVRSIALPP